MSLPTTSSSSPSRLARAWHALSAPPFRGLPVLVWCYFIGCFFIHPESTLRRGNLPDADDYMYIAQIQDWLNGQNWFDNIQHRLDPAAAVPIDFSRLAQVPMVALMALLAPFLGKAYSSIGMAMLLPPLELIIGLLLLRWIADSAINKGYSRLTAFVALFAPYLIFQFSPGHIDHHGLTALLVLAGFGTAARVSAEPDMTRWPVLTGILFSLALAVGLEILPALILITLWLGFLAVLRGGPFARAGFIYGISLTLSSVVWLVATIPPEGWFTADPLGYSIVYVIFCASIALCFSGVALVAQFRLTRPFASLRLLAGGTIAAVTGYLFLGSFPTLISGPYGAMDSALAGFMFANIPEAIAIIHTGAGVTDISLHLIWPVMALVATAYLGLRAPTRYKRWFWLLTLLCLGAHTALAAFYQIRFLVLAQMFAVIPLAAVLAQALAQLDAKTKGTVRFVLKLEALLLIAPLPTLILPALLSHTDFIKDVVLFPVQAAEYTCDMHSLAMTLGNGEIFGSPQFIINDMGSGPQILARTPHSVLSAPFHTNVAGNMDAIHFFTATNPDTAKDIMTRRNAGLVVLCKDIVDIYKPLTEGAAPNMATQLAQDIIPPWLTPIHYNGENDYLLFKVSAP